MQLPDVKASLSGGCDGISAKYLHWEEDLIVGGSYRGKSGQLIRYTHTHTHLYEVYYYMTWWSEKKNLVAVGGSKLMKRTQPFGCLTSVRLDRQTDEDGRIAGIFLIAVLSR